MKPIEGWNDAPAYTGEFETLPAGKYVCKKKEGEKQNETN